MDTAIVRVLVEVARKRQLTMTTSVAQMFLRCIAVIAVGVLGSLCPLVSEPACGDDTAKPNTPKRWAIVAADVSAGGLADLLTAELSDWNNVELVERGQIRRVLDELKLNASGLIASERAVEFGKLTAAEVGCELAVSKGVRSI